MQPLSNDSVGEPASDEISELKAALETEQAAKTALKAENTRLRTTLYKRSPDWKTKYEETLRLEKEAARAKVRSGDILIEPVPVDPLNRLLVEDTPEGDRVALWLEALQQVEWAVAEKGYVQALRLAADYHLLPTSQIGRKGRGQQDTVRALLKFKLEQAAAERIIETGTETGMSWYARLLPIQPVSLRFGRRGRVANWRAAADTISGVGSLTLSARGDGGCWSPRLAKTTSE
jgi:hypothetical protein